MYIHYCSAAVFSVLLCLYDDIWYVQEEDHHFMDKTDAGNKEIPEDVTRESLIALSYTEPPEDLAIGNSPAKKPAEAMISDGNEKYRSELISISYSLSPETPTPGVHPGELKG